VLFALLHVQYSWFGMALIAILGLLLGTIRQRTSTSVAIAVHALYDVAAVVAVTAAGKT
jgi:membrane protease YdiL (CAAX protease family)